MNMNRTRYQYSVIGEEVVVVSVSNNKMKRVFEGSETSQNPDRPMSKRDIRRVRRGKQERKLGEIK